MANNLLNYSNTQGYSGSPERYNNPKLQDMKTRDQTDWAELVRYHQNVGYYLNQQERDKRWQQKMDFRQANGMMMNEKQQQRNIEKEVKMNEALQVAAAKEEFDQYQARTKYEKLDLQKGITAEYDRERQDREDTRRNMVQNERQIEQQIVNTALDSLDKERYLRDKRKQDMAQLTDQTLREAEVRKMREAEYNQQNRQDYNRMVDENNFNQDMKDLNYKMYYQRISDRQAELQQAYDRQTGHQERSRDNHINDFVNKGMVDAKRKAMEEEMRRQAKRDELYRSTIQDVRSRIEDHQFEKQQQKQELQQSIEQRRQREQELQDQNYLLKQLRSTQINGYKATLENQARENEEQRRRRQAEMTEHEKRALLQNYENALIPGLRSSKFDELLAPQLKTTGNFTASNYIPMPQFTSSARGSVDPDNYNSAQQTTQIQDQSYTSSPYLGKYNPITNPVPNNLQNPYLVKDFQKGMFSPRNYLAVMADKHLIAGPSQPF